MSTVVSLPSSVVKGMGRSLSFGLASWSDKLGCVSRSRVMSNLLDRLSLLSPRTWYGVLLSQTQSDFHAFDGQVLAASFASAVIPLFFLAHFYNQYGTIRQREFLWRAVTPVSLLSPWNMAVLSDFFRQCRILVTALSNYWYGRVEALPSAIVAREVFLRQGRLTARRRYDVYWPSTCVETERGNMNNEHHPEPSRTQQAILLLPGFGISHVAYSEVACRLSNAGHVVVVPSMEPLRIAHRHLGADSLSMWRIMKRVQGGTSYKWHLLGHSAGAFGAMHLYDQFYKNCVKNKDANLGKLVLWGCAAMIDMATDLSYLDVKSKEHCDLSILFVQATNDSILKLMKDNQDAFDRLVPASRTSYHWIQGGTHHGFASYSPSWLGSPEMVESDVLSYSNQQAQACEKTLEFLLQ